MRRIIIKLDNAGKWGGAHTVLHNIMKCFPSHIISDPHGKKLIQKALKELVNKRFLLAKPSTGEIHISLNPAMAKEIDEFLEKTMHSEE